ncbi:MAG: DUF1499 domain-containing protein, partial [Betaproteobacteria bacterium]
MIRLLARFALLIATLAAIAVALSGPGYRMGWWPLPMAFDTMRWAAWVAIGAAVFGLVLALIAALARPGGSRRGLAEATLAILVGALTMAGPITLMSRGKQVPPIHDISTDTDNPPQFAAVLPARVDAQNPVQYGGPELAAQQKKAFPQIVPVELAVPPAEAFERALRIARDTGWVIIDANQADLRIEATATTPFFGFKDDVVVRVTPTDKGSRVDMRSLSRIGRSDLGANARRVE